MHIIFWLYQKPILFSNMSVRRDPPCKCDYCDRRELESTGHRSSTVGYRTERNVFIGEWFCCDTCLYMRKHELGITLMPNETYNEIMKKCYGRVMRKRNGAHKGRFVRDDDADDTENTTGESGVVGDVPA